MMNFKHDAFMVTKIPQQPKHVHTYDIYKPRNCLNKYIL